MEKRFILFIVLSMGIMAGYIGLSRMLAPPPKPVAKDGKDKGKDGKKDAGKKDVDAGKKDGDDKDAGKKDDGKKDGGKKGGDDPPPDKDPDQPPKEKKPVTLQERHPLRRATLGSVDPGEDNGFRHLWTFHSRGAAIERIELSSPRYRDLDDKQGYLGHLMLSDDPAGGCRVNVVGPGTPASRAKGKGKDGQETTGLRSDPEHYDVIRKVDGEKVSNRTAYREAMKQTKPGQTISLEVERRTVTLSQDDEDNWQEEIKSTEKIVFQVELFRRPLEIVRPEYLDEEDLVSQQPLSCLMTLRGGEDGEQSDKLDTLLRQRNWQLLPPDKENPNQVAFQIDVDQEMLELIGQSGRLQVIKRYKLIPAPPENIKDENYQAYHLDLEIEIRRHPDYTGDETPEVSYQLDGPNGLPTEGWWYTNKIHPSKFRPMGARDVVWKSQGMKHSMVGCPDIYKAAVAKEPADKILFTKDNASQYPKNVRTVTYMGLDAQYFSAVLIPQTGESESGHVFESARARTVIDVDRKQVGKNIKRVNVSFRLNSAATEIGDDEPLTHRYQFFAGPKEPKLLKAYGLEKCISYGWFGWVSKPLILLLHGLHFLVRNYGLAIILLTVLVRLAMMPLSRKAAKNMQITQQLAPEMKKIKEKYKNDMQKQGEAMRALYRKYNFNPFSGCWMMFLQLPVFLGLYRGLSTDIALRGQGLIPGFYWCSNLAAPDRLLYWKPYLWDMLGGEASGWLGPYLNVLPLLTISLFIVQQKMFTPPAADEQAAMQQKMMKFMMIFMGVLFFKVASGLCIYFITSSIWGIVERKMMPKPGEAGGPQVVVAAADEPEKKHRARPRAQKKKKRR